MALAAYADATALIGLARIDHLDLLTLLPTPTRVTARVWEEVAGDSDKPGAAALERAREAGLLVVVAEGDPEAYPQLDPGESTVLTAAAAARAAVILDERKARALLELDLQLNRAIRHVTGIIGLILLAKRRGRIPTVRPLLDELRRQSFWIGQRFYDDILRQAGER
jgi:predicted nucleic acid-binding protein